MEADTAFLETLDDLRKRSGLTATEYDHLQAAGLIRRLLLESKGKSLFVLVNETRRVKLQFTWWEVFHATAAGAFYASFFMDPGFSAMGAAHGEAPTTGTLSQFMQARIALRGTPGPIALNPPSQTVTVSEVVRHFANRLGGVHYDVKPPGNPLLREVLADASDGIHNAMGSIARIVVRALDPLASQIYEEHFYQRLRSLSDRGGTPSA